MNREVEASKEVVVIMRCVGEEEWPAGQYQTIAKMSEDGLRVSSVDLVCPAGHSFDLKEAVKRGSLTERQKVRLLFEVRSTWEEVKRMSHGPSRDSDFVADKEVLAADILCMHCGQRAAWSTQSPEEDLEACRQHALCLNCRAGWQDYARGGEWENVLEHVGRAWKGYWEIFFSRFVNNPPAPDLAEARALYTEYKKQIKKEKKQKNKRTAK